MMNMKLLGITLLASLWVSSAIAFTGAPNQVEQIQAANENPTDAMIDAEAEVAAANAEKKVEVEKTAEEKKKKEEEKKTDCEKKAKEELKLAGLPAHAIEAAMKDKSKACVSIPPTNVADIEDKAICKTKICDRIAGDAEIKGVTTNPKGDPSYYGDLAVQPKVLETDGKRLGLDLPEGAEVTEVEKMPKPEPEQFGPFLPEKQKEAQEISAPEEPIIEPASYQKSGDEESEIDPVLAPKGEIGAQETASDADRIYKDMEAGKFPTDPKQRFIANSIYCIKKGQIAGFSNAKINAICNEGMLQVGYHESAGECDPGQEELGGNTSATGCYQHTVGTWDGRLKNGRYSGTPGQCQTYLKLSLKECIARRMNPKAQNDVMFAKTSEDYEKYVAGEFSKRCRGMSWQKCYYVVRHHTLGSNAAQAAESLNGFKQMIAKQKYTNPLWNQAINKGPELAQLTLSKAGVYADASEIFGGDNTVGQGVKTFRDVYKAISGNGTPTTNVGFGNIPAGGNYAGGNIFGGASGGSASQGGFSLGSLFGGMGGGGSAGGAGGGSSGGGTNYGISGGASAGEGFRDYAQYPLIIGPLETAELQPDEKLCVADQRGFDLLFNVSCYPNDDELQVI